MEIVVGHANPDFDAYAATVAATKLFPGARGVFLGTQNANVRAFHNLHEEFLDFVDFRGLDLDAITRIIMVDTRDPARIGELGRIAMRPEVDVIVYDHHPPAEGDLDGIDDRSLDVGATTSILVHEIHRRGIGLAPLEASLLLLGIHEDTGSLTYPGSTAYDAEAVAYLMSAGAEMEVLSQFLMRTLDEAQQSLLEALLGSLEIWEVNGQRIAVGVATAEEYVDSASVLTHYVVEEMGHRVAIALIAMPGRLQIVARSRIHEVDVGAVMESLGGGGHAQAAAAAFRDTDIPSARTRLREALAAIVRPPLLAKDIMSKTVRTITPDATMGDAGELMSRWGFGGLPVMDGDVLVGLITRKDVDKAARHRLSHAPVRGFMSRDITTVSPDEDLQSVERLLVKRAIGRLPILAADGSLLGILSRKDLLRAAHGEEYLDRRLPTASARSTERFLASVNSLLPAEALHAVRDIGRLAEERGMPAHAVGGFVRDMLLGRRNLDIDIVVEGDGVEFAQEAARVLGGRVKVHRRFGTAVLVLSRTLHLDITSARTEYYTRPGALPTVERSSLRQDLFRRDFTVNAMAACINPERYGQIADPFGGLSDLERGTLRILHSLSFVEDPTRVLRAARFELRFGFTMNAGTEEAARRAVEMGILDEVSGARIREEMLDIIDEDSPSAVFERMSSLGVLDVILPEGVDAATVIAALSAAERGYTSLSSSFPRLPRRRVALTAAIVASAGRRSAERWLHRMRFGREYALPALVLAVEADTLNRNLKDRRKMRDSRLYRLLEPVPAESLIYVWGVGDELARGRIERFVMVLSQIKPAISGQDLIEMGLPPSAAFSGILSQALDARLDGRAVGRVAELAYLKKLASRAKVTTEGPRQGG